jgi:hypothetical protein
MYAWVVARRTKSVRGTAPLAVGVAATTLTVAQRVAATERGVTGVAGDSV